MATITNFLTYELVKKQESNLPAFFTEWIPKMTNRVQFKPEFDRIYITEAPANSDYIAIAHLTMIETILKPRTFSFTYYIYATGGVFAVDLWNGSSGARPYAYPIEMWANAILTEANAN